MVSFHNWGNGDFDCCTIGGAYHKGAVLFMCCMYQEVLIVLCPHQVLHDRRAFRPFKWRTEKRVDFTAEIAAGKVYGNDEVAHTWLKMKTHEGRLMTNVKVHGKFDNQLLSIKGVDPNYSGKIYLQNVLNVLIQNSHCTLIHVRRNYYEDHNLKRLASQVRNLLVEDIRIEDDLFEISFHFSKDQLTGDVLWILIDLWFSFEQPAFFFLKETGSLEVNYERFLTESLSWSQIANIASSCLMFKSVEEDVVWIGKSSDLSFDSIVEKS